MKPVLSVALGFAATPLLAQPAPPPPGAPMPPPPMGGVSTRTEAEARAREIFARVDGDHDGFVTRAEADAFRPARGPGPMADGPPPPPPPRREGDAPPPPPPPGGGMDEAGMLGRMFDRIDTDGDGRLSPAEAIAAARARFDRMDRDHDGKLSDDERRAGFRAGAMQRMRDRRQN